MPQGVFNPPPSEPMDPVAALTAAGNAAGNHVDPGTVVGAVKSSQSIGEAVTNIQAIAHTGNTVKLYDTMQGMDHSQQASAWQAMSPGEQAGLRSVGYTPPNLDALSHIGAGGQHGGFWSDVGNFAEAIGKDALPFGMIQNAQQLGHNGGGKLLNRAAHDVNPGQIPGRVINDALSAAGAPLRAVQHLDRAGHALAEQGIANQEGWQTAAKDAQGGGANVTDTAQYSLLGSPSAWSKAWDETTNGNTTIDPAIHRQLTDRYGPDRVRLANQVSAEGADAVVQSTAPAQQQAVQAQVNDPHFQDLVKQISASRMSPGRAVVGTQFILQHPEAAKVISGSIDAAIDIASDPTMHIGRAAEAAQVARYGLKDASSAQAIIQNSKGVDMYAKRIEPLLQQGRYGELGKVDPRLDAIAPQLARQNVDSAQKFKDFLASEAGMKAILSGDAAKLSHGTAIIPHLSYLGWSKSVVKDGLSASMDRLSDGKASTLFSEPTPLSGDEVMGEGEPIHLDTHSGRVANAVNLLERGQIYGDVGKIPGVSNVARLVRNTITDIPDRNYILNAPQGLADADVKNFRRWVGGVLPAAMADDLTNIFTSADEPQRRLLVTAMNKQVLHATGVYNIPDNAEAADRMMQELDNLTRDQAYSVNGNDVLVNDNGLVSHHALGDGQTAPAMTIVLPHQARALVRAHSMLSVLGVNPLNGVDRMMGMWRSMILDRPGFAVRMALDENVNRILRLGPKNFLASAVAGGAARATSDSEIAKQVEAEVKAGLIKPEDAATRESSLKAMDVKPILPYHPVERALSLLADRVPPALRPHMKTISDFYGGVLGAGARRWARKAEKGAIKAFGMQDYVNGATHYLEHQDPTGESMQDVLTGGMGGEGPIWTTQAQYRAAQKGGKASIAQFSKSAPYSEASPSDELFRFKWQVGLDTIAHSKLMRAVLETIHQDPTEQRNAVLGVLNDPSFAEEKSKFVWSKRLQDGRHVNVDATQEEADRSWAEQIVRHVNDHVRTGVSSGEGPVIQNIVDHMLSKGQAPDQEMLDEVAQRDLPQHVYGPDVVEIHPFSNFLHRSFEEMVGKPMNWMARQPHFIHQYTDALKQIRPWAEEQFPEMDVAERERMISDLATHRALNAMTPFIHNPELRTQFEDVHRNLFPFLFAQRQFLQRWGRTFADSPSSIRELQLTMNGLRTSGVIRRDQNGNDYFYYPGAQYVTEMLTHTLNRLGVHATIPFSPSFTGQTKYLIPGLSNPTTPSVGPFAAVSINELAKLDPATQGFDTAMLQQGAGESAWRQFLPSIATRVYDAMSPAEANNMKASTTMQAMKYLDYSGHGLPNNPTNAQVESYIARLNNWSTQILLVRAALGFVLPATPGAQLDPKGLATRLHQLMDEMPYDKALAEFIKENPDGQAYTVSESKGVTSGNIPATSQVEAFTNQHAQFARSYPSAFPWIAPRSPGKFDLIAFQQQISDGERLPKVLYDPTPGHSSFVTDIIDARSSSTYYSSVDNYEAAYNQADPQTRTALTQQWDQWKAGFFQRNPVFAQYIASQAGHQDRIATIQSMEQALKDPKVPDSPAVPELKDLMQSYNNYLDTYNGPNMSYSQKTSLKAQFIQYGTDQAKQNPEIADFWNSIIRPEADSKAG